MVREEVCQGGEGKELWRVGGDGGAVTFSARSYPPFSITTHSLALLRHAAAKLISGDL